ncbi:MFS transporter [Microtetraspora malaysiensis]|uniref:MFS transporter n=1 Tax=Microtetraspora malaysiensis TaxID=161358 RepID=UPI00082D07D2|nr:MFS transporter [Microtetraspora malaysiensis]
MVTITEPDVPVAVRRRAWGVVTMLLLFMLVNFMDKAVLGLAGESITAELGLTSTEFGAVGSAFYLLFSLSGIVVGGLTTRFDSTWILVAMMACWCLSQLPLLIPAAGFGTLVATRVVLGAAEGPAHAVANHAAFTWFPDRMRNLPASVLTLGSGMGVALGAPVLIFIITNCGWRWAFGFTALAGLAWLPFWLRRGGEGPYGARSETASAERRAPYRRLLCNGTVLGGVAASFAVYWTLALALTWFPQYLQKVRGYSLAQVGPLSIIWNVAGFVVIVVVGVLTQRLLARGVSTRIARGVVGGVAVLVAGAAMTALPRVGDPATHLVLLTVAASFGYVVFPLATAVAAEIAPVAQRGAVLGTVTAVATMAGVLAPVVTGALVQGAADPAEGYGTALTVAGLLMLGGGALAALAVRPELDKERLASR